MFVTDEAARCAVRMPPSRREGDVPSRRIAITGGHVLSMDPAIGELERGGVLIEDDRIVAVERDLGDVEAELIDAAGAVIMPGFIDTHRHTWQTALRGICADWTLLDYFLGMRSTLSPRYTAEDVYVGQLRGCARGARRRRHDDPRLLALQQHARACRPRDRRLGGRGDPRGVRLRLLRPAARRPALHHPRDAPRRLEARERGAGGPSRRSSQHGHLAHRAGVDPVRRDLRRGTRRHASSMR